MAEHLLTSDNLLLICTEYYNYGYAAGHDDTIDNCYTNILMQDMNTYHDDIVSALLRDDTELTWPRQNLSET